MKPSRTRGGRRSSRSAANSGSAAYRCFLRTIGVSTVFIGMRPRIDAVSSTASFICITNDRGGGLGRPTRAAMRERLQFSRVHRGIGGAPESGMRDTRALRPPAQRYED
ncbi:hypothetical protein [Burkholderia pseudomallei]|uniref:hypothetical protein n=1 Tax=Burkholderia pseudomallei TaxID=28450 RepID=UPI00190FA428|nr:hypothetical protein [Burkholderia pseudomallei]